MVQAYGGDVIKFAGDALIIAFYPLEDELVFADGGYRRAVMRCAHCALEVRRPEHAELLCVYLSL